MKKIKILLTYTFAFAAISEALNPNTAIAAGLRCLDSCITSCANGCNKYSSSPNCNSCCTECLEVKCEGPVYKVYDPVTKECVCPDIAQGLEPSCLNGTFNKETCVCDCDANYYNNGSGCSPCPDGGKSVAGATSITQCYVTTFSDATGSGTYTSNCYYKE